MYLPPPLLLQVGGCFIVVDIAQCYSKQYITLLTFIRFILLQKIGFSQFSEWEMQSHSFQFELSIVRSVVFFHATPYLVNLSILHHRIFAVN